MMPATGSGANPHVFSHLIVAHRTIGLHLHRPTGGLLGSALRPPDPVEIEKVRGVLADANLPDDVWIEDDGDRQWVRGVVRLTAGPACTGCHTSPGETLGVATMKIDFTAEMEGIRRLLRRRVGWLLAAWVVLVGAVAVFVQATVRRSLTRLEADFVAATTGKGETEGSPDVALDPAAAKLYQRLREFLRRQREREAEVVSRLAHADQLATLGQLSAGLAHEIKNPLAGIQGAIEVLRDDAPDPSIAAVYDDVLRELKRVNSILQRLLESGRQAPLRLARTNLGRLLEGVAELMQPALRRKRVELKVEVARDLPETEIDAARIRQVLLNLVQNAGDALEENGGHVTIRADVLPGNAGIVIAIEDDGPGIPPEDMTRLFEPFFTTKFTGTGLGLTISKGLVEQHGGRIEVDSERGRGATFFIFLPAGGASSPEASPREEVS
jgi:signal transduction histidine kinase